MDYALQKATELGVNTITPLFSERCGVKLSSERQDARLGHWQKKVISAVEQSGRCDVPIVRRPEAYASFIKEQEAELKLVCAPHIADSAFWPQQAPNKVLIVIGPEGGFSEQEIQQSQRTGFHAWQIGPRVLRTETAPLLAISIIQQRYGDFVSGPR